MLKSGFFNSIDGDRKYNADDFSDYFEGILTDGIFASVGTCFQCWVDSDMTVLVASGRAKLLNKYIRNTTDYEVQLDAADVQYDRIDTICLKVDKSNSGERSGSIIVVKGTPAENAKYPEIPENTTDVAYLRLSSFLIERNSTNVSLVARHVGTTDTPYVQIDKSINVEAQYKAFESAYSKIISDMQIYEEEAKEEFEAWFSSVSGQLTNWIIEEIILDYSEIDNNQQELTLKHQTEMRVEYKNDIGSDVSSVPILFKLPAAPPNDFHAKAVVKGFTAFGVDGATNLSGFKGHNSLSPTMPLIGGCVVGIDVFYDGFGYRFTWYDAEDQ